MMKRILVVALCAIMLMAFVGCTKSPDNPTPTNAPISTETPVPEIPSIINVEMTIQDYGVVKMELYPEYAPQSVYNFVYVAKQGLYNGTIIHRISPDFVVQTGGYGSGYVRRVPEGDAYTILGEFSKNNVTNELGFAEGIVGWARSADYNSATTQFFICLETANCAHMDGFYAPFGKVIEGMNIIKEIGKVKTVDEKPVDEIMITLVNVLNGENVPAPDFIR